jgi:MFS family permease
MKDSIIDALRVKPFAYLMSAELFTQLGANIFNFYLIFAVFSLTKSNTAVAAIVLSFTIPAILFGIPAGIYVDRWNKKYVLLVSNLLRALLLVILAFLHQNIYAIFFISFFIATFTQFFIPAESPIIPSIVPKKITAFCKCTVWSWNLWFNAHRIRALRSNYSDIWQDADASLTGRNVCG